MTYDPAGQAHTAKEASMHDVGMNMSQLEMSIKQIDDTIAMARTWSHDLLHACENFDMEQTESKLSATIAQLDEAREALAGYAEAVEADHNSIGTVRMV